MKHWAQIMGQVKLDNGDTTIECLDCGESRGLTLVTDTDVTGAVIARCPNGHRWQDARISQDLVIYAATAGQR